MCESQSLQPRGGVAAGLTAVNGPIPLRLSFELDNRRCSINTLVNRLKSVLHRYGMEHPGEQNQIGAAVRAALLNAMYHGNLRVPTVFHRFDRRRRTQFVASRRERWPFRDLKIQVRAEIDPGRAVFLVRDEGLGFDFRNEIAHIRSSIQPVGRMRGLLLMHMYMDEVEFLGVGNEVRLVKEFSRPADSDSVDKQ